MNERETGMIPPEESAADRTMAAFGSAWVEAARPKDSAAFTRAVAERLNAPATVVPRIPMRRRFPWRPLSYGAAAAAILLAAGIGSFHLYDRAQPALARRTAMESGFEGPRRVQVGERLDAGNAAASYRFDHGDAKIYVPCYAIVTFDTERSIRLEELGIWIDTTAPAAPYEIKFPGGRVAAVNASFGVGIMAKHVLVNVDRGTATVTLDSGEKFTVAPGSYLHLDGTTGSATLREESGADRPVWLLDTLRKID